MAKNSVSGKELDRRFGLVKTASESDVRTAELLSADFKIWVRWLNMVLPEGREKALTLTRMEEAFMWANAALLYVILKNEEEEDD